MVRLEAQGVLGFAGCVRGFLGSLLQPQTGRPAPPNAYFVWLEVCWRAPLDGLAR
jgi:hypothetical protein